MNRRAFLKKTPLAVIGAVSLPALIAKMPPAKTKPIPTSITLQWHHPTDPINRRGRAHWTISSYPRFLQASDESACDEAFLSRLGYNTRLVKNYGQT